MGLQGARSRGMVPEYPPPEAGGKALGQIQGIFVGKGRVRGESAH